MRRTTAGTAATLLAVGALAGCSAETGTAAQNTARADIAAAQALAGPAAPASASGVTVVGSGTSSAQPDVLYVDVGVEVEAKQLSEAFTQASEAADRVVAALQGLGIAEEDIQTQDLSVRERRAELSPPEPAIGRAEITGYVVRNMLQVTIDDVDRAGEVLAAVVEAGGDAARVDGLRFAIEDDDALRRQAREEAVEQARTKAEQYAELVGRELGPVVAVTEVGTVPPTPPVVRLDVAAPPVEPGLTTVSVQVQATWELG